MAKPSCRGAERKHPMRPLAVVTVATLGWPWKRRPAQFQFCPALVRSGPHLRQRLRGLDGDAASVKGCRLARVEHVGGRWNRSAPDRPDDTIGSAHHLGRPHRLDLGCGVQHGSSARSAGAAQVARVCGSTSKLWVEGLHHRCRFAAQLRTRRQARRAMPPRPPRPRGYRCGRKARTPPARRTRRRYRP